MQKIYSIHFKNIFPLLFFTIFFSSAFASLNSDSAAFISDDNLIANLFEVNKESDSITDILEIKNEETALFRFGPVEDFFMDWDTSVVDPYHFDIKEITYDFPLCLFISPNDEYTLPLKSLYRTSAFGPRWGRHHKGIDYDLNTGDSVFNMFDGMVRISTYIPTFGNFVVVRHYNGLETFYAHLSDRNVSVGDILKSGDCVGLGGSTGRSTGPHLHFEIRYKGIAFDPENLICTNQQDITTDELTIEPNLFSYLTYKKGRNSYGNAAYHTIRSGETLSSIAAKHKTTVAQICRLNGIKSTSVIRAGKTLRIR
jgi:hypothetical protein